MYGRHSSFSETFRLLGIWPIYTGDFEFSNFYVDNAIAIVATYLLPAIAVCTLIFVRRSPLFIFLLILLLFSTFMAVGGHASSPLKGIYVYLYDHLPLFPMFRNGYKFVGVIAFIYVVLISIGLFFLLNQRWMAKKKFSGVLPFAVVVLFFTSALPLFRGQLFSPSHRAEIPSYWHDAAKWLDNKQGHFRVFLLPDQYFATYKWGGYAGFFSAAPYLSHDVISNTSTKSGNEVIQMLYGPLSQRLNTSTRKFDGQVREEDFCKILGALSIEYIVQRNDIDHTIYNVSSPMMVRRFLERRKCVKFIRAFGKVDIYEVVGKSLPRFYIANSDTLANLELGEIH
jgi:hypothetical protein